MTTGEFIGRILGAAVAAHILHLKSLSYPEHMALGDLYPKLHDHADSIVEVIQGSQAALITDYPTTVDVSAGDALGFTRGLIEFIATGRKDLPQDSEIQNLIDELLATVEHANYKLTFLK